MYIYTLDTNGWQDKAISELGTDKWRFIKG
jgi:hypothetical protein